MWVKVRKDTHEVVDVLYKEISITNDFVLVPSDAVPKSDLLKYHVYVKSYDPLALSWRERSIEEIKDNQMSLVMSENAQLWHKNMLLESNFNQEISLVWYTLMIGGA